MSNHSMHAPSEHHEPPDRPIVFWPPVRGESGVPTIRIALPWPQRWLNVLGTVAPVLGAAGLRWCLDDSLAGTTAVGPDGLRLAESGDFNIELPLSALSPGTHLLRVFGDADGAELGRVQIAVSDGDPPPAAIDIDFASVDRLEDAAAVVDGLWRRTPDGWRTNRAHYDRLLAFGHTSWTDYRATLTASIHGFTPASDKLRGGLGLLSRWSGHRPDGHHPCREWRPNAAIGWYRAHWDTPPAKHRSLNISDAVERDVALVSTGPVELALNQPYCFELTTVGHGAAAAARYRVWAQDRPEQLLCDLGCPLVAGAVSTGSLLLIALYCDVTLHRMQITEPGAVVPQPGVSR